MSRCKAFGGVFLGRIIIKRMQDSGHMCRMHQRSNVEVKYRIKNLERKNIADIRKQVTFVKGDKVQRVQKSNVGCDRNNIKRVIHLFDRQNKIDKAKDRLNSLKKNSGSGTTPDMRVRPEERF